VPFNFAPFTAVLLDLDGTLYHEEHPIPGAAELVRHLQGMGRPFACLSNSTGSPQRIARRLANMGIAIPAEQVYTATAAAADYVLEHGASPPGGRGRAMVNPPRVFNLSSEGIDELLDGRVHWVQGASEACDFVVAGTPTNVYATEDRQRTALHLLRQGARLIGICADRVFPSPRGLEFGAGALCAMLGYAANVQPTFTGKPEAIFFEELCAQIGVPTQGCLLIGDNLESDIAGAKRVGMKTILTLTGVTRRADLDRVPPEVRPDWVVENLGQLLG
jgi:HAD superfamily hydrolase (TIGR01450 family)